MGDGVSNPADDCLHRFLKIHSSIMWAGTVKP